VQDQLDGGVIGLYNGTPPADGDAAETGTLLALITLGAAAFTKDTGSGSTNGLTFADAVAGVLVKTVAEEWKGVGLVEGYITYARHYAADYVTGVSTTGKRVDFTTGTIGTEVILNNTKVTVGVPVTVLTSQISFK